MAKRLSKCATPRPRMQPLEVVIKSKLVSVMSIAMVSSLHIPINRPRGFMFSRNTDMSASHLRAAETLKKKRVDSGSFCCSYRAYFPTKPLKKRIRAQMCMISSLSPSTSGPQPDVEEEGSALDFPEVPSEYGPLSNLTPKSKRITSPRKNPHDRPKTSLNLTYPGIRASCAEPATRYLS
eukprot:29653-Pelagococcus_subviridis.AAC.4